MVTYSDSISAIKATITGNDADIVVASAGEAKNYLLTGQLIALANFNSVSYDTVPSIVDTIPGFEAYFPLEQWVGFKVPSDTPEPILNSLKVAFKFIMNSDEVTSLLGSHSSQVLGLTGIEAKKMALASESALCWILFDLGATKYNPGIRGIPRP